MDKNIAISVENIGKKYRIRSRNSTHRTLGDLIATACKAPFKKIQALFQGEPYAISGMNEIFWALKDVSFEIKHGEVLGIIGSNGAGKSTLLKILSRITRPTEGKITLCGKVGSLLEVGTGFHPELTGRDNIFLNGAILGMKRDEIVQQFDEIVAFAEIEKFIDTPVKFYSSGMYIRLAFAVAAHLKPDILIVDEVLAVGDVRFQKKCLGKMEDVAKEGRTVLFVSHNIPAIRSFCTRAILLEHGRMTADGSIESVLKKYLSSTAPGASEKMWENGKGPSNGSFRMNAIRIVGDNTKPLDSIMLSQNILVEVEYEILSEGAQAGFSLILFDIDGHCIFSSLSNFEKQYYGRPLAAGTYKTRCTIYGNLLNDGKYFITLVGFGSNRSEPFTLDRVLSIETSDDGVLRGDYHHGEFGGFIRPKLDWKTTMVSEELVLSRK